VNDYPALLRARRKRDRWGKEEKRLYRRHRWRSEGFHGEAKSWHGLARAVRRGLENMRIQSFLTAMAINLKRLAAAFLLFWSLIWRSIYQEKRPGRSPGSDLRFLGQPISATIC
ncbi:transposase, partial [Shinella zoogloeoides]|uniref:transposase n=2 Tax=Shinella TaxID=323620 RepID=UPI001F339042